MIYQTLSDQLVSEMGTQARAGLFNVFEQIYYVGIILLVITVFGIVAWLCYAEQKKPAQSETSEAQNRSAPPIAKQGYVHTSSLWTLPHKHPFTH